MDPETRQAVIGTIRKYTRHALAYGGDTGLLELVGWTPTKPLVDERQAEAAITAVLPLLDDEQLNTITRHIAELLVRDDATAEVQ